MTDNEIIKALECCSNGLDGCRECPAKEHNLECGNVLKFRALNLINRQKAEIARLKQTQDDIDNFARSLCEERVLNGKAISDFEDLQEYIRKEQSKAVKEFADQLITDLNEDIENYTKAGQRHEITDDIDGWLKYYIRAKLYKTERDLWKMDGETI